MVGSGMGLAELVLILSLFGPPAWTVQPLPPLTIPVLVVAASVHAAASYSHARAAAASADPVSRVRRVKDSICACKDMACVTSLDAELRQLADVVPTGSPELEALAKELTGCLAAIVKSESPR